LVSNPRQQRPLVCNPRQQRPVVSNPRQQRPLVSNPRQQRPLVSNPRQQRPLVSNPRHITFDDLGHTQILCIVAVFTSSLSCGFGIMGPPHSAYDKERRQHLSKLHQMGLRLHTRRLHSVQRNLIQKIPIESEECNSMPPNGKSCWFPVGYRGE